MTTDATPTPAPPAARLRPDGRPLMVTVTWLLVVVGTAALAAGWPGLAWAGALAGLPGWMHHLAPVIVDGVIVVLTLAAVARRGHGQRARWMWSVVAALVVGSAAVQVAHALDVTAAVGPLQLGVAAALAALPPLIVVVATHAWLDLAVAPAPARRRAPATARPRSAPAVASDATAAPSTAAAAAVPDPGGSSSTPTASRSSSTPTASRSSLTPAQVAQVAELTAAGVGQRDIAVQVGSTKSTIARAQAALRADAASARPTLHAV